MTDVEVYRPMDQAQIELLKDTICKGADDNEMALFVEVCERTGLNPFARQIFAVKRWDSRLKREVMQTQVSIDGARLTAQRSGRYAGQTPIYWCGTDKVWTDVWLEDENPAAAKVGVYMTGAPEPLWAVATWKQYVQTTKDGRANSMWAKFGPLMIGKCAEMLALRKAFPMELSGLYSPEEMGQAEVVAAPAPAPKPSTRTVSRPSPLTLEPGEEPFEHTQGSVEAPTLADEPVTDAQEIVNEPPVRNGVVTQKQLGMIGALLKDVGIPEDRDIRLGYVADVIGRKVESSKEMTKREASTLIEALIAERDSDKTVVDAEIVNESTGEIVADPGFGYSEEAF